MSKLGVAFALFAAMAFSITALGNVFAANFTPFSYLPLAYSILLGLFFVSQFLKL